MIYLKMNYGLHAIVLDPNDIAKLLDGKHTATCDKEVFLYFTPDVMWLAGEIKGPANAGILDQQVFEQLIKDSHKRNAVVEEDFGMIDLLNPKK